MWYSTSIYSNEAATFYQVFEILTAKCITNECTITDPDTGELLFKYWCGNVEYIQGEFAKKFFKWVME